MINLKDIEIIQSEEFRLAVRQNIDANPAVVAMNKRLGNAALVAMQVKYLQRAKSKLPSYFGVQCIVPPIAFEQSSSELTAANKHYSGGLCVDLTCGLGVDTFYLSKRFERVVSLERDPVLAAVARANFQHLGLQNVEVVEATAEQFIAENQHLRADLIYADPDRRGSRGEKLVRLEDCSPNMVVLMDQLKSMSELVVVKCSPLFDVDEAFRLFGQGARVEVVSVGGECKEVVVEVADNIVTPRIVATAIGVGSVDYGGRREKQTPTTLNFDDIFRAKYLVIPDVSLQKARLAVDYFTLLGIAISKDNGYGYASEGQIPENLMGRVARIDRVEIYKPRKLAKELKAAGVKNIDILKRAFPLEANDIAHQLGVSQGGKQAVAFTTEGGTRIALFITFLLHLYD